MVNVLDVPLYEYDINTISNSILADIIQKTPPTSKLISATGAHGIIYANQHPDFKAVLNSFYVNLPDGMPGVWVGRAKGATTMQRCYGPDFFKHLISVSADKPIQHFFCGGKEGVADELKTVCNTVYKNNRIAGTFCPPFREMTPEEWQMLAKKIADSGADIVWVGLSTPKQEYFAAKLKNFVSVYYIITVGAAFDFHTGKVQQAPKWMQKSGLEWFFRLLMEPRRLYKRYFTIVPLFIFYNIKEFIKLKSTKNI
jgi:N-acetylglucosaminyldiphosphoundecaprenol N-acetyl-beta-D-mannosaminyltransferase